jgi:hypothetical protein
MLTAILHIKTTIDDAAQECMSLFGEGARFVPDREEHRFALGNTPMFEGYCRVNVASHIAQALEYLAQNYTSDHVELVKVEWDGQEDFPLPSGDLLCVIV